MSERGDMPIHKPVRWVIECSCGAKMDRDRYDQHVHDAARELGKWVAGGILDSLRSAMDVFTATERREMADEIAEQERVRRRGNASVRDIPLP